MKIAKLATLFLISLLGIMPIAASAADPETTLWNAIKATNLIDDYETYLVQYPNGKYVVLVKSSINKLQAQETAVAQEQQDRAAAEAARQDKIEWASASNKATEASYLGYLQIFPQGQYAALATARIAKIKKETAQVTAQVATIATFRDCPDCPEMVSIPAGSFDMGSRSGASDQTPVHRVTLSRDFAMGKTEVTQGQWKAIMGNTRYGLNECGDNCPAEEVSWDEAKEFIQRLSSKTGKQYRLPSEAEWEYACRAGMQQKYCGSDNADSVGWNSENTEQYSHTAHTVATKQPNAFGLYDMSGNVWEWVEDNVHNNYYGAPIDGSVWRGDSEERMIRGGSYVFEPQAMGAGKRRTDNAYRNGIATGFRLAASAPAVVKSGNLACFEWGNFSGTELDRALSALNKLQLGGKLSQREIDLVNGFWVYIPPLKDTAAVNLKLAQLKAHGVTDYFVVQEEGEWLNAISLGVFKSRESAQNFLEGLREKNVATAKMGELSGKNKATVFIINGLDADMNVRLAALQKDFAGSELKLCTEVRYGRISHL